uniref:hypothetical protein n=1 Tax=Escherichia coli TaxID=562 RepID=UPI001BC8A4F6
VSIKNDGHYFCRAGGNRPDGLNEPVTQNPDIQQKMQRREEVNINVHRERGEDVEPGDDF